MMKNPIKINLDDVELSAGIKKDIEREFEEVLNILDFKLRAQDYFRRWYIVR